MSKQVKWTLAAIVAVTAMIEIGTLGGDGEHHGGPWNHIPLFDFFFGFAACWIIVVGSKALGHSWLQRPENYYDSHRDNSVGPGAEDAVESEANS